MAKSKKHPKKKPTKIIFDAGVDEPQGPACPRCGKQGRPNPDQPLGPPGVRWWFCANPKCPAAPPPHTWFTVA